MADQALAALLRGNHHQAIPSQQSIPKKTRNVAVQRWLIGFVKLNKMPRRGDPGRHYIRPHFQPPSLSMECGMRTGCAVECIS